MPQKLAVIIPALNEEAIIAEAIESAWNAGASEVVVADGGSTDGTARIAAQHGAMVVLNCAGRGAQLNAGARSAQAELLVFLHADTSLPANAAHLIAKALESGSIFGGFRTSFREGGLRLGLAAWLINFRTALSRCPWGDQAQFVSRETFESTGGYAPLPLMEDYELAVRMKRLGRTALLKESVSTSGRRFLARGVFRTMLLNWRTVYDFRRGADPALLAERYRRV
jgi:rSAM/selenodomain-associated transferase 2